MDDREFFDELYQQWSKTTGAEDRYWAVEEHFDKSGRFNIFAVSPTDQLAPRKLVAVGLNERDADFLATLHAVLPDLVGRLHEAFDEADRADYDRDSRECRIAELETENTELREGLVWYMEHGDDE